LVITGEGDFCYPAAIEPWANIPDAEIVIMEGATHMPHLELPEDFTTHLLRFLAK
jgi:L-proline amide hydrolase